MDIGPTKCRPGRERTRKKFEGDRKYTFDSISFANAQDYISVNCSFWICCRSRHLTTRAKECARLEARQWIRKEAQRWPRDRERDIRESRQRCKDNGSQNGRRQKPPICLKHSSKRVAWGSSKILNLRTYRYRYSLPKRHQIIIAQQIKV